MTGNYGLVTSGGTAKTALAQVSRWSDRTNRHTLYTVCGTQQDGWGIFNTPATSAEQTAWLNTYNQILKWANPAAATVTTLPADGSLLPASYASPDAIVGRNANTALFNWVPISYPASSPDRVANLDNSWQPRNVALADSVAYGVDELVRHITSTQGTFALVGMSQGSMVVSNVMKRMLLGSDLFHRQRDCIAAVTFGNPMRKFGRTFPGGTAPAGAGIFSPVSITSHPMLSGLAATTYPSFWWEMVTPNDFFADVPLEHLSTIASVARAVSTYRGVNDPLSMAGNLINAFVGNTTALEIISVLLTSVVQKLLNPTQPTDIDEILDWLYDHFGNGATAATYIPDPHVLYGVAKPPTLPTGLAGVDSNSTYIDVALAYINARGQAVAPR